MKITKNDFDKLGKKSKEEYKKRIDKIKDIPYFKLWVTTANQLVWILAFTLIAVPLWKLAFGWELAFTMMRFLTLLVKIFLYLIFVGFIIDYIILLIKIYKISEIRKDYFEIKVKDEKRN